MEDQQGQEQQAISEVPQTPEPVSLNQEFSPFAQARRYGNTVRSAFGSAVHPPGYRSEPTTLLWGGSNLPNLGFEFDTTYATSHRGDEGSYSIHVWANRVQLDRAGLFKYPMHSISGDYAQPEEGKLKRLQLQLTLDDGTTLQEGVVEQSLGNGDLNIEFKDVGRADRWDETHEGELRNIKAKFILAPEKETPTP